MKHLLFLSFFASACLLPLCFSRAGTDSPFFFFDPFVDPLALRDDHGLLHQSPRLSRTDFAPRYSARFEYYFESGDSLIRDPAYVGALQTSLRHYGYYCGPIDGVFSDRVADAIARVQKNNSLNVTGTLTFAVRRALHLP
jgi:hypothetical protein